MGSQQHGIQEDPIYRMDSICGCNIGDEGATQQTPLVLYIAIYEPYQRG